MEFPGGIVSNIIEQRIGLPSNSLLNDAETHDRIIQQISHVLSYGLSMDIFILLTNENCLSSLECNSVYPIECWKIQRLQQNEVKNIASPPLLPLFLKNAIRSQLHFSPINAWLSQNNNKFPEGFRCSYRIAAKNSSNLKLPEAEVEAHSFPLCKFATLSPEKGEYLSVSVEWIRFTDFPQLDFCSCKLLNTHDAWVLPTDSPPTSAEDSEGTISSFPPSPNGYNHTATKTISKETDVELLSNFLSNSSIDSEKHKRLKKKRTNNSKAEDLGEGVQKDANHQRTRRSTVVAEEQQPASSPIRARTCKSFSGFSTAFNPKTRLPLNSSPAPSKRTPMSLASKLRAKFSTNNGDSSSSDSEYVETKDTKVYGTSQSSNALLCNFEESALNGRIEPISNIEGFKLQLAVSGSFSINHTMLPLNTYFFDVSGDAPSLMLGHCTFKDSPFGKKTVRIPKKCVVQATLFNPQGSVVRIFIVRIDVSDMPPRSKTFIRQRTCATAINDDKISLSSITSVSSSSSLKLSYLRYLINLRLISDRCGRIYLHTDIRLLFSNNQTDIDIMNLMASEQNSTKKRGTLSSDTFCGSNNTSDNVSASPITYELITLTEMPEQPKYSPIK